MKWSMLVRGSAADGLEALQIQPRVGVRLGEDEYPIF